MTPIFDPTPFWLRRFTKLVAGSTLFLIFAGAMVTSHDAGLAVPDWPNTYGQFMWSFPMSKWVGNIFYEHGHRLIASTVGFLVVIQAIWLQLREPKRFLRILGWCSLGTVIAQGILGGVTVLLLLPKSVSIAHAGLAEIFLCVNVAIAFFASDAFTHLRQHEKGDAPVASTTALVALVYAQILVGALMRHLGAGLAIPTFPMPLVPPAGTSAVIVNYAHRVGALLVAIAVVTIAVRLARFHANHPTRIVANFLLLFVAAQILLGGYTIWSGRQPVITSLHVMFGALTLATSLVLALTARATAWRGATAVPGRRTVEVAA
ncbi:MAG TPA: COX15/CtaA family protein [Thermoanaerobaculia bacterium]|nr:COX15/CtaA family protein [Thermoanaerobaculia bacterium]